LPADKFVAVPTPGTWSIGEEAMHLVLSMRTISRVMGMPLDALSEKFGVPDAALERDADTVIRLSTQGLARLNGIVVLNDSNFGEYPKSTANLELLPLHTTSKRGGHYFRKPIVCQQRPFYPQ
jgi:hypothetical protein